MEEQKVVLITGVSSGLGRATAQLFARQGYRVFGTKRDPSKGESPAGVDMLALDVRDQESVEACVTAVITRAGRVDILINNAGYALEGAIEDTTAEQAKAQFDTNLFGVASMIQAVLPHMRQQGRGQIINISSLVGWVPLPFMGFYSASKFALEGYTEALQYEVQPFGIHVSMIEPGFMRTHLGDHAQVAAGSVHEYEPWRRNALEAMHTQIANATAPERIAKRILHIARQRAPRLRYRAGQQAAMVHLLRRFLPQTLFERVWRRQFHLDAAA